MRPRRFWLQNVMLLSLCSATVGWCVEVEKVEEKTFSLSSGGNIVVKANEGSILIKTWEKEKVLLKMTKRAWGRNRREAERLLEEIEVRIQTGRDRLVIKELDRRGEDRFNFFDLFDGEFWREKGWRSGRVDFELTVPEKVRLDLESDEGDVEVTGTEGKLIIQVDEGEVEIEDVVSDHVEVNVDEGDISLYSINDRDQGLWKLETDEGDIFVEEGTVREVDLSSDEGEIVLKHVQTYRFWLTTDEGDIQVDFQPIKGGSYRMETDEGDLEIFVPEDADLRVKLRTYEGRIESDFDLSVRDRDDGEVMEGVIGRNNGLLRAFTDEGDVILRKG